MKKLDSQENAIGPHQESKENQSSPTFPTKKTKPEGISELPTNQSTNGSNPTGLTKPIPMPSENEADSGSKTIRPKKQKSLMPVPKLPPKDKRAELALKKLKVKPEILASAPKITPLLKTSVKGGLKAALDAMRFATDDHESMRF